MKKQKKRNIKKNRKQIKKRNFNSSLSEKTTLKQTEFIEKLFYVIEQKEFFNNDKRIFESKDVIYIPSYKSLPYEIVEMVNNQIKNHPIRKKFCYYNSTQIGLSIPDVEIVHGFYKDNLLDMLKIQETSEQKKTLKKLIKYIKSLEGEWVDFNWGNNSSQSDYINTNTLDVWRRHVWNKYKGVHFDLTVEINRLNNLSDFKQWVMYKEVKTFKPFEIIDFNQLKKVKLNLKKLVSIISGSIPINDCNLDEEYPIIGQNLKMVG